MAGPRGTFGVYVVISPKALDKTLGGTNGPIARNMLVRGNRIKNRAKELVGVSTPPDARAAMARKPGTLRDSIVTRLVKKAGKGGLDFACIVGSNDPIALWHHEGTIPHVIRATKGHGLLVWRGAQKAVPGGGHGPGELGGLVVIRGAGGAPAQVNHPGTQPNRFLVNAIPAGRG